MKNVIVVSFKVLEVLIVPLTYFDDYFGDSCYFGDCEVWLHASHSGLLTR